MLTLESLQNRVRRLEDIKDIERLQGIYGYYRDYAEWDKIVDLYSERADSVEIADQGVYKGKEGIKRYYLKLLGAKPPRPGMLSLQIQLQGVITVSPDGNTARGRWYGWAMEALPTASIHEGELRQVWTHGIYENEYVKENGKWLFSKVHYSLIFRTPYEDGWLKTPVVGQIGPSLEVPPDAPPTAYHPYPSRRRVPYHYPNPVTGK
ncbi:MAG TPA: nuclear transport factor 2 family protein [Dehalococcoidales bacterium]|nr:nuclear transport factor 2 family protein [Dehalococcoidales bacterium]